MCSKYKLFLGMCLTMALVAVLAWPYSMVYSDEIKVIHIKGHWAWLLESGPGYLSVTFDSSPRGNSVWTHMSASHDKSFWLPAIKYRGSKLMFVVPYWLVIAMFGSAYWLCRRIVLQQFRRRHGLCLSCGYDLRAAKNRCPECGSPIEASHNASILVSR